MRREQTERALVAGIALICAGILAVTAPPLVVSAPLGFVLLALPGLVWVRVAGPVALTGLEMLVAVVASNLGLLAGIALILTLLPMGLTRTSWAVALGTTVGLGVVVGEFRGSGPIRPAGIRLPSRGQTAVVVGGLAVLGAAGVITVASARDAARESFTELSLVPVGPQHDPRVAKTATVQITNHEHKTVIYRLVFATGTLHQTRTVRLREGETFHAVEPIVSHRAVATLYKAGESAPYREVWLGEVPSVPAG